MTDLELIAQLEGKIQQLPPQMAIEVNDYVDFLLQKYRTGSSSLTTPDEIWNVALQRQQAILQQVDFTWDDEDSRAIEQAQAEMKQWNIQIF